MRKIEVYECRDGLRIPIGFQVLEPGDFMYDHALPIAAETVADLEKYNGSVTGFLAGCGWDHPPTNADEFIKKVFWKIPPMVRIEAEGPARYVKIKIHGRADRKIADKLKAEHGYHNVQWRPDEDGTYGYAWRWEPVYSS